MGRPWKDAIISILEPRSPYAPWSAQRALRPADDIVAVLDTDPPSVLTGVGSLGNDADIRAAIANSDPFLPRTLVERGTLNMFARSHEQVVSVLAAERWTRADALFGHSTLISGRILLGSGGRCTCCGAYLRLMDRDAREHVHIHTVDFDRGEPADWPATMCTQCHLQMRALGFTNFLDFLFECRPGCPECGAKHALTPLYGLPSRPVEEPWICEMGCSITKFKPRWVCGSCRCSW